MGRREESSDDIPFKAEDGRWDQCLPMRRTKTVAMCLAPPPPRLPSDPFPSDIFTNYRRRSLQCGWQFYTVILYYFRIPIQLHMNLVLDLTFALYPKIFPLQYTTCRKHTLTLHYKYHPKTLILTCLLTTQTDLMYFCNIIYTDKIV